MNQSIRWAPKEAVYKLVLKDDFIFEEKLFDCNSSIISLISPIMIFHNKDLTQFYCYSFLANSFTTTEDTSLAQKEIHKILKLEQYGWALPAELQLKLFPV